MHLLDLAIFGKYCIHHILCEHCRIVTIFQQYQLSNLTIFPRIISTRKKIIFEELPNSSETEDMRKIRQILPNLQSNNSNSSNIITEFEIFYYTEKNISEFFLFFIGILPQGIENRKIYYLKGSIYYCESEITG